MNAKFMWISAFKVEEEEKINNKIDQYKKRKVLFEEDIATQE